MRSFLPLEHSIGREAFITSKVLDVMKLLFSSYEPDIVRLNAHKSIEVLVLNPMYTQVLVDADIVPLLMVCLEREYTEIKVRNANLFSIFCADSHPRNTQ